MSSSKLIDTEAGGETPQYESIKTVDKPTETQTGQLGGISKDDNGAEEEKLKHGEHVAENIRYGQGISEGGFGGETEESTGEAHPDGHGGVQAQSKDEETKNTRREQKYGSMPPIGA